MVEVNLKELDSTLLIKKYQQLKQENNLLIEQKARLTLEKNQLLSVNKKAQHKLEFLLNKLRQIQAIC